MYPVNFEVLPEKGWAHGYEALTTLEESWVIGL